MPAQSRPTTSCQKRTTASMSATYNPRWSILETIPTPRARLRPDRAVPPVVPAEFSTRPWCGASSRTSVFRPRCRSRGPPVRRLRRPGSRSSLSTERPSASRPTSDCGRDSGRWRGTRRAREGTSSGAQPRARGRTRPEIDASAILNSPQSASRPENPPCTGLRACPTRPPKAPQQVRYRGADLAIGPLWRLSPSAIGQSSNRAFTAAIIAPGARIPHAEGVPGALSGLNCPKTGGTRPEP